ncbi:hypothetical protein [Bradyrhizobium prioriisuperbiae]|uniref:hypothetical protein n=1 Tax=Bradyrhizobium prioriisuperbiae TaxID=2854389 RepID=UPI0028E680E8|nr:hypothetical protein [Bradyrhizobium prioritasuperba]
MRRHWENCVTHFDEGVYQFIDDYFVRPSRHCVLVAGAGFDPRAKRIAHRLSAAMGSRVHGFFIREERGDPAANLQKLADETEAQLKGVIADARIAYIQIFSADDQAPIGGHGVRAALEKYDWPKNITDIVLDMSALSTGIGFPLAKLLLEYAEAHPSVSLHVMVVSNPELDDRIIGEPSPQVQSVRGYSGPSGGYEPLPVARIWLPQLGRGRVETLRKIRNTLDSVYKVCPVVPFPARNPRRADELLAEYQGQLLNEWQVDARDLIYVSERNPLDCYRTISTLKSRYDQTVEGVFFPQLILSPFGSKVIAVGAMMAAIEHNLSVQYVETLRYEFEPTGTKELDAPPDMAVHVWLHGPVYGSYDVEPEDVVS